MKGNYNPFNKTYQYLCFQQHKAHKKNLNQVKSLNQSNVKIVINTSRGMRQSRGKCISQCSFKQPQILYPYLVIHKNKRYDSKRNQQRINQNRRIASKLMKTSCSVFTRDQSLRNYSEHKRYEQISRKYSRQGKRKDLLKISRTNPFFYQQSSTFSVKKSLNFKNDSTHDFCTLDHYGYLKPKFK